MQNSNRSTSGAMIDSGNLLNCDEAAQYIERIADPVTRSLVNLVFVHLVKTVHFEPQAAPSSDLDMQFLARSLERLFSEHDVLARTLAGERIGAFDIGR